MFKGIKDRIFGFYRQEISDDLSNRLPYVNVCKYDSLTVYKNKAFVYLDDYLRDRTLLGRTYPDPNDIPTTIQLHNSYVYYWCEGYGWSVDVYILHKNMCLCTKKMHSTEICHPGSYEIRCIICNRVRITYAV